MDAEDRRKRIVDFIRSARGPLTGGELAARLGVTRQVVVQDVALLRAGGLPVLATPSGYMLLEAAPARSRALKVFTCRHDTVERAGEELRIIVENGGLVRDVIIEHPIYGEITGALMLGTVPAVEALVERLGRRESGMLTTLTGGVHMHTVEADSQELLERIEEKLRQAGILL